MLRELFDRFNYTSQQEYGVLLSTSTTLNLLTGAILVSDIKKYSRLIKNYSYSVTLAEERMIPKEIDRKLQTANFT